MIEIHDMDVPQLLLAPSLALTLLSLIFLIRLAPVLGLMDAPGGRKRHARQTPVVGGLAIAFGLLPLLALLPSQFTTVFFWFTASAFLLLVGLADDIWDISPLQKLLAHVLSGVFLVMAGLHLTDLGHLLSSDLIELPVWVGVPLTLFAVATAINGMNMIDGIDGLLGLVAAVPLTLIMWLAWHAGLVFEFALAGSLLMGLLVFLMFNFRFPWVQHASVFLGDTGSTLVGFNTAWLVISLAVKGVIPPVLALYLMALPLLDMMGVILRRRLRGVSWATPGRDHLHHILLDAGFSVPMTSLLLAALALLFAGGGLLSWSLGAPEAGLFAVFVMLLVAYVLLSRSVQRVVTALHGVLSRVKQNITA